MGGNQEKIPEDFKIKFNGISWKNLAGMGDRLIHDYMGVNYEIVWDIVINKIPELHLQILNVVHQ